MPERTGPRETAGAQTSTMPLKSSGPRRYLIATGVTTGLQASAGRLVDSVGKICDIFQDTFDYERVAGLDLNPTADDMRHGLRAIANKCDPDDIVVLYHTGHGDLVSGAHRLWMGNTGDPIADTLATSELADLMLARTPVSKLLVILDTCLAGHGGTEMLMAGIKAAEDFTGKTLLVITSAHPKEQVRAGDFAGLFERSVNHPGTAGHEPPFLSPAVIVAQINQDLERKEWQTVSYSTVFGTDETPFLPNPRHNTVYNFDLVAQRQMEQDEQRRVDLEKFFYLRARGVDVAEESGWYFVGRQAVLRHLTSWLTDKNDRRTIVVTGDPGSGKSAVIGRLYILSDRDWSRTVPRQGLPADTIPPVGSIDVAILARNRTSEEVFQRMCAAVHVEEATTPREFLRVLKGKPIVVVIDAIDEAVDPDRLVSAVLNPLIEAEPRGFRMLLGTRSNLLDHLSPAAHRVDLDDEKYADPKSLRRYARERLQAVEGSPYITADPAIVEAVAEAVARAAHRSFLIALITSRMLAAKQQIPDPADRAWRDGLPGTAAQAMQQDLETRLGGDAARACALLRPLAYAAGRGLPWEDIWAPLASALARRAYRDEDLIWLRRTAGSYVVEAAEGGRSVYHLYHAALAEYLRHGQDNRQWHGVILEFLLRRVPRAEAGEFNWPAAHPYILAHLATHAAAADDLDQLVIDPGYLASARPPGLLAAFPAARGPDARLAGVAYQRAMHRLRPSDLADRLSYLELAARRTHATALAERVAASPVRRRWSVSWLQWPPDYPHRVLVGHEGPVREVIGIAVKDRAPRAASVGDDGTLRLWDLGAAEPIAVCQVGRGALAAVDIAELPGPAKLAVVLSTTGVVTAHEFPSMLPVRASQSRSGFRDMLQPLQLSAPEMRCIRLPDGTWAAATGGPGRVTTIWDIRTGQPIARLSPGIRPAMLEFRTLASGVPVVVSADRRVGTELVFDLATGHRIPGPGPLFQATSLAYYCRNDGTPVLCIKNYPLVRRGAPPLFDLTGPQGRPLAVRNQTDGSSIQLADGSRVLLVYDDAKHSWQPYPDSPASQPFIRLHDTAREIGVGGPPDVIHPKHARPINGVPFVVTLDGRIIRLAPVRPTASGRDTAMLTGHGADVTDADLVAMPGQPAALVSSSIDGTVRLWDIAADVQATPAAQVSDPSAAIVSTLTHRAHTLGVTVTGRWNDNVAITDLSTGEIVAQLNQPSVSVMAAVCGWLPGVGYAVVTFDSFAARIWRLPGGDPVVAFQTYVPAPDLHPALGFFGAPSDRRPIQAAYVPLPGRPLTITCGDTSKAVVWDLVGRRIHAVLGRHTGTISALACGTDQGGTPVAATGGQDNRINIWKVTRGRRIGHFRIVSRMTYLRQRESGHATSLSLIKMGRRSIVLALCEDGKLRIFRRNRWRPGFERTCLDTSGASSLAVLRLTDGRTVAMTGHYDGRLCAWDMDAALSGGGNNASPLIQIETEVTITGLCVGDEDTVVLSTLSGLAAFRLHAEHLPRRAA
jgi:WD40 repeat protein